MAERKPQRTDGSSIVSTQSAWSPSEDWLITVTLQKPVSSLLSHFEGLAQIKTSHSSPQSPRDSPRFQKLADKLESVQSPGVIRASFDLPRPDSPWSLTASTRQNGSRTGTPEKVPSRPGSPEKQGIRRPTSMLIQSSPQLVPSVSLESPRSPPRGYLQNRSGSRSPDNKSRSLANSRSRLSRTSSPSRPSSRPNTPRSDVGDAPQMQKSSLSSGTPGSSGRTSRDRSIPPPINRADKPKVQPKTSITQVSNVSQSLAPKEAESASEHRVSPFSTPPSSGGSSPEMTFLPPRRESGPAERRSRPLTRTNTEPYAKELIISPDNISRPNDPRTLGFSRSRPANERPEGKVMSALRRPSPKKSPDRQKISAVRVAQSSSNPNKQPTMPSDRDLDAARPAHIIRSSTEISWPPPSDARQVPSAIPYRDARQFGFSSSKTSLSDADEDRPGLPPRRFPAKPPPRPPNHTKVPITSSQAPEVDRPGKNQTQGKVAGVAQQSHVQSFPPPPKRNTDLQDQRGQHASLKRSNDSDAEEELAEEFTVSKSEYPDTSQSNRRPPYIAKGQHQIPSKFESRVFDVCGHFICAAGYTTKVWDMSKNDYVLSLNHGETVKVLSVAFKPGGSIEEEGSRIWIGNTLGEIHEIDIATQSSVASSAAHARREVIRILRQQNNMWTLDEDGKLFVWTADESGCPNLRYSHHSHRVNKGHTYSVCIGGKLWHATGKEIRIYRPGNEASFHVLQKALVQPSLGDVTSGTYTARSGGQVFFGHTDGKVSIYSTQKYTFIGSVKVSDYKINSLSFVGDWLWAAYKTGKIYVYDTSSMPWKVKKDWKAHDGPTASMILDPSSIWTLGRLQVASLGYDNAIRLWDGMLEEDWMGKCLMTRGRPGIDDKIEGWMQNNDIEYCRFREIKASIVTWNVGATHPFDIRSDFICDVIHVEDPPEILVFGFQELVDLEDKSVTASKQPLHGNSNGTLMEPENFFGLAKKKDASKVEHISKVYREWRDYLGRCINRYMGGKATYNELHTSSLIGLFSCIFIRQDERPSIRNLEGSEVKCGMKGHYGNKVCRA